MAVTVDGWADGDPLGDIRLLFNDIAKNNRTNDMVTAGVDEGSAPLIDYGVTVVLGQGGNPAFIQLPPAVPRRRVTLISYPGDAGDVAVLFNGADTVNDDVGPSTWNMPGGPTVLICSTAGAWFGNLGSF